MKCRLIETIGERYEVTFSWQTGKEYHISRQQITKEQWDMHDLQTLRELFTGKMPQCKCCNQTPPPQASVGAGTHRIWNTEDGENNHPGDMYFAPWLHDGGWCPYWDNCKDPRGHLIVVLPNGHYFDTDSRASNCNKPQDRIHRCWEKHGEPPLVTIGGPTSDNGVGSIGSPNYHGYLRNGELVQ